MIADEKETLRALAGRWMELASLAVMAERKRQWTALKDLRAERPMFLFETWTLGEDFVREDELLCTDPGLRAVELQMRRAVRQAEEIGDDFVLEPHWRVYWDIEPSDYGVTVEEHHSLDDQGGSVGYAFNHPIRTPADLERLRPRTFTVNRQKTLQRVEQLNEAFGDLLPVVLHGTGGLHSGLTSDLFRLIGNDNLLTWPYDAPEALHRAMAYLRDDRLALFRWMEAEGLLGWNNDVELVGSGSPGYTTRLAPSAPLAKPRLQDLWVWMESQETTMISPAMFAEFFLPYMAEVSRLFGLIYYGCCEPVHDRWDHIQRAIPNVGAVSVSPWCRQKEIAGKLGRTVVYSRKPRPWPISGSSPDWAEIERDLDETLASARDCNLEIIFRDVYRINADRTRLRRWADLVRSRVGGPGRAQGIRV